MFVPPDAIGLADWLQRECSGPRAVSGGQPGRVETQPDFRPGKVLPGSSTKKLNPSSLMLHGVFSIGTRSMGEPPCENKSALIEIPPLPVYLNRPDGEGSLPSQDEGSPRYRGAWEFLSPNILSMTRRFPFPPFMETGWGWGGASHPSPTFIGSSRRTCSRYSRSISAKMRPGFSGARAVTVPQGSTMAVCPQERNLGLCWPTWAGAAR